MKKAISILLALTFVLTLCIPALAADDAAVFPVCDAVIVVGKNASETDLFAAQKLEY